MNTSKNRIAFVYEFGEEVWSTPASLMNEFKRRGYEVHRYHLTNGGCDDLPNNQFDILLTMDWKGIDIPESIHADIPNTVFKIRENADTPQNFDKHIWCSHNYNLLLTPDYQSTSKYQELGHNTVWFNHFADSNIHTQYLGYDDYPPVRSTRGHNGSLFMSHLEHIIKGKFINKNGMVGAEYGSFLSNGKITLQNSRFKEITRRLFEGASCDTLVLADRISKETNIDELFVENQEIVYYDGYPDCVAKINYYLSPEGEKERLRIAHNGFLKVRNHHTQIQRVDLIIEKYNEWKISQ